MKRSALAILGMSLGLGHASAEVILTFGFTDLAGSFERDAIPGSGDFRAEAVDSGLLRSAGDVSRLGGGAGTANFDDGFVSRSDFANVVIDISVFNNNGSTAQGLGTFRVTDDDGDTLTGTISGTWVRGSGSTFFNGDLSNVGLADNESSDGVFNGTDGGLFGLNLPGDGPYEGAFVQLFINNPGFFSRTFRGISVQVGAEIIPTPGALALAGLAGVFGLSRRRRAASRI